MKDKREKKQANALRRDSRTGDRESHVLEWGDGWEKHTEAVFVCSKLCHACVRLLQEYMSICVSLPEPDRQSFIIARSIAPRHSRIAGASQPIQRCTRHRCFASLPSTSINSQSISAVQQCSSHARLLGATMAHHTQQTSNHHWPPSLSQMAVSSYQAPISQFNSSDRTPSTC